MLGIAAQSSWYLEPVWLSPGFIAAFGGVNLWMRNLFLSISHSAVTLSNKTIFKNQWLAGKQHVLTGIPAFVGALISSRLLCAQQWHTNSSANPEEELWLWSLPHPKGDSYECIAEGNCDEIPAKLPDLLEFQSDRDRRGRERDPRVLS